MVVAEERREGLLSPAYLATTVGMFALVAFNAFEVLAVTTVMPTVAKDLDGLDLYAISFAGPLAASVVGMVAAGQASDRVGPRLPMLVALTAFAAGLLVAGTAPTMEVLVAGRVVQGLGGGAFTVLLYVMVGIIYPPRLQPGVFALFAAAWVLPSLFGPSLAALINDVLGWRWVFLGVVALVGFSSLLIAPAIRSGRSAEPREDRPEGRRTALGWAAVAAAAVAAVDLLGSELGPGLIGAAAALVVLGIALRPLLPAGTLRGSRGLPSVIGDRAMMSAGFLCSETYVAFALQDRWGWSPGHSGIALSVVGVVWALASQVQSRIGEPVGDEQAMRLGALGLLTGTGLTLAVVAGDLPAWLIVLGFGISGAGMGFGYPRTGTAMLRHSTERDRGFNSSAIAIADALGGALALSLAGVAFTVLEGGTVTAFLGPFSVGVVFALAAVLVSRRTYSEPGGR